MGSCLFFRLSVCPSVMFFQWIMTRPNKIKTSPNLLHMEMLVSQTHQICSDQCTWPCTLTTRENVNPIFVPFFYFFVCFFFKFLGISSLKKILTRCNFLFYSFFQFSKEVLKNGGQNMTLIFQTELIYSIGGWLCFLLHMRAYAYSHCFFPCSTGVSAKGQTELIYSVRGDEFAFFCMCLCTHMATVWSHAGPTHQSPPQGLGFVGA